MDVEGACLLGVFPCIAVLNGLLRFSVIVGLCRLSRIAMRMIVHEGMGLGVK